MTEWADPLPRPAVASVCDWKERRCPLRHGAVRLPAYRRAAVVAFREVDDSLAGVLRSGEQATSLAGQRDALAAALRNASNRYRAGYSSYLDQLDAQRGLLNAELTLIQAQADRLSAYVSLYQALGGGWSREDVETTSR